MAEGSGPVTASVDQPKVGVFSMWHNRSEAVDASLESILGQTYPNIRFVLVDDGSSDETYQRMQTIAARHVDREIDLVTGPNRGFTASLRTAIERTPCDYVAIHDAGDISHPTRIEKQVALAGSDPGIAVVGCHVGLFEDGVCSQAATRRPLPVPAGPPTPDDVPRPGTHGAALIRRRHYDEVGGYRTALKYSQDADLWLRLQPLGAFAIVPELLHWRYESASSVSGSPVKSIAQRFYSELARQCAEARAAGREDLIDRFGQDAVFFIARTRRHARSHLSLVKRYLAAGDLEAAETCNRIALDLAPDLATRLRARIFRQRIRRVRARE